MSVDIPNYRIVEKLGVGAESHVYRARCMRTGKDYAVKIVKIVKPEDSSYVELLKAEYAIGSVIDHPVIRKVYELRFLRKRLRIRGALLFMEYVDGMPLSDREFRRPMDEILRVFGEVAAGLNVMHTAGFVHADLKPGNILVSRDGAVKVIDLGQSARANVAKNRVQGTIDFIAPEQVQRGVLTPRTDVFGLGAALHRVVTGKPVPTEMNQTVTVHSQSLLGKRVSEVRQPIVAELPTCVSRLIDDCCHSEPAARLADMPTVIERIALARAILARQAAEPASSTMVDDDPYDDEEENFDRDDDPSLAVDEAALLAESDDLTLP